ncbi:hypothetical protein CK934_18935 [Chitinophaga sp. MD30]|nr:hypothetical protein CK934_18935 [Chitinophaga sp. MD30]
MDPQERLFIESCWQVLEDAGYTKTLIATQHQHRVGVFAGITKTGFELYGPALWQQGTKVFPHTSFSSVANRISYLLNLQGPSMPIDTMCSSSLTAVHEACEHLLRNECELAIAGGVNLYVHPASYIGLCSQRMLSASGNCRSFGEGGDGFVPGEGVGTVLLKRLSQAEADGDHIYAVIRATGINHGGKTNGYTVPNPIAQGNLIRHTLDKANVNARTISFIEAHGTGTVLGDPIEISGLTQAFTKDTSDKGFCAISTVKSNIGHLEAAAGIAGLTKIVLQLQHQQLVPSLHAAVLNPNIDFENSPFNVQQQLTHWQRPVVNIDGQEREYPRLAGLSSFGAGGANAHVIVEEYIPPTQPVSEIGAPQIIVLSAKEPVALLQYAAALKTHLQQRTDEELPAIAYTLQTGREAMEERLAIVTTTISDLSARLAALLAGETIIEDVYRGQVKNNKETLSVFADEELQEAIEKWLEKGKLGKLTELWVKGLPFDWKRLYTVIPNRTSLPTYPFAHERYWFSLTPAPLVTTPAPVITREPSIAGDKPAGIALSAPAPIAVEVRTPEYTITATTQLPAVTVPVQTVYPVTNLQQELSDSLAEVLLLTAEKIDIDKNFVEMGLDSIVGVEWVRTINQRYNIAIPATRVYDYPTIRELASLLQGLVSTVSPAIPFAPVQAAASISANTATLRQQLRESFAALLYLPVENVDTDKNFVEMGLDSIVGVEWIRLINKQYNTAITATKVYDYPTINELTAYLTTQITGELQPVAISSAATLPAQDTPAKINLGYAPIQPVDAPSAGKGLVITNVHTLSEISWQDWKVPAPAPGEVTIQVIASAINFPDTMCIRGLYPTMPAYPFVPGFEVAGIVIAVGAGVTDLNPGDEVVALTGDQLGGHATVVNVKADNTALKPVNLSFEEVCTLPVVFGTVYYAFELGKLKANDKLLIHTATGGCGLMALQLAQLQGADVYASSSREEKLALLRQLDVKYAFNYMGAFDKEIRSVTNGKGVDIVLNMLSGEHIQKGLNSLAAGGRYLELAVHGLKTSGKLDLSALLENQTIHSIDLRRMSLQEGATAKDMLNLMRTMAENGQIVSILSRVYPAQEATAALAYVDKGSHIGKIVISHRATEIQDYQDKCLSAIRDHKHRHAAKRGTTIPSQLKQPAAASIEREEAIAIVGMSGQFPRAANLDLYWDNLKQGKDCVTEVPGERWSTDAFYDADITAPGKTVSKWMGWLEDADKFDPLFFSISPAEAELMDPQQRLFLENCWSCIEDAGIRPGALSGTRTGVYVGCAPGDYGQGMASEGLSAQGLTGGATSILSARISYLLNLKGPCLAIDTACSSTLVAIAEACNSLVLGGCDLALAGGVCVLAGPLTHILTSKSGMLSPTGRCHTFDGKADGFVPGEGVGVVLLKRLKDAEKDGDDIYGVIRGWGINQDGKTNGITAPSVRSQTELEQYVYDRFKIDPATITMIEAHGTGTQLGDPIEVEALVNAFRKYTDRQQYCALGASKSNVGHLLTAAGAASVIKVLLSLQHRELPPSINFQQLNQHIQLDGTPFYVNTALKSWETTPGIPRRAAISAFGFSGTNAHLVIEEHTPARVNTALPATPALFVLSAKEEERLLDYASRLAQYLQTDTSISLTDIAYTLQTGRDAMSCRLAFVADTRAAAITALNQYTAGTPSTTPYTGKVKKTGDEQEIYSLQKNGKDLDALAAAWVNGKIIPWEGLYDTVLPKKAHIPTYPFARDRYWLSQAVTLMQAPIIPAAAKNISPLQEDIHVFQEQWVINNDIIEQLPVDTFGTLICFANESATRNALEEALYARGIDASLYYVVIADTYKQDGNTFHINPASKEQYDRVLHTIHEIQGQCALLYLWAFEDEKWLNVPANIVHLLQGIAAAQQTVARVLLAGQAPADSLAQCYIDAWIGFERSLGLILPDTKIIVTNLQEITGLSQLPLLLTTLLAREATNNRYTASQRYTRSIAPVALQAANTPLVTGGTYLITGGAGGIGFHFAKDWARRFKVNLILNGRSPLNEARRQQLTELERLGSQVLYISADVTDRVAMKEGLISAREKFGQLNGVLHAAGISGSVPLPYNSIDNFERVLSPKIKGTLILEELLQEVYGHTNPSLMIYCASSSAVIGDFGGCDYAVANRFQQAYAHYRQQNIPGKTCVINWPLWQEGGMQLNIDGSTQLYLQSSGQRLLGTAEALEIFDRLVAQTGVQYLVIPGDKERIQRFLQAATKPTTWETSTIVDVTPVQATPATTDLTGQVITDLKSHISLLSKIPVHKLDVEMNLADFGFDSINLATLARNLTAHFGWSITPAVFFGYTTIEKLAQYFVTNHLPALQQRYGSSGQEPVRNGELIMMPADKEKQVQPVQKHTTKDWQPHTEPIAIIGMSGRFPQSRNIDELWELLANAKSGVTEVPAERFDWQRLYGDPLKEPGKTNCKWLGAIPGVREFDPLFFEISPREAATMDPRQRLLLQEAWNALEDAGYGPAQIKNAIMGMFVGVEDGDYALLAKEQGSVTANHNAILAARLAYFLNFNGPVMAINTACSSGLVAAHQACSSLRNRECDAAIAAGVNLLLTAEGFVGMGQAGMLSPDGTCYAFDKRANGLVPGEAVTAVVLKRLSDAEKDGDPIYAVIKGSGINYDGKSNGITAPNSSAQAALLQSIYSQYDINPENITYIVTHGTGTRLGDPVEIQALDEAFKRYTQKQGYCALTSAKSNLGHSFAASGLVSLISLVQAMRNETIPASLHCEQESDYIDWVNSCFFVNRERRNWTRTDDNELMGAVSAFGMSGTNAHLVVESYTAPVKVIPTPAACLLVLSAKTAAALQERIANLVTVLESGNMDLTALSHTLQNGRYHFRYRCSWIATDITSALDGLKAIQTGAQTPQIATGTVPLVFTAQPMLQKYVNDLLDQSTTKKGDHNAFREILEGLGTLFCQGYDINWTRLQPENINTPRLHLPVYPFARTHYWVAEEQPTAVKATPMTVTTAGNAVPEMSYEQLLDAVLEDAISIDNAISKIINN